MLQQLPEIKLCSKCLKNAPPLVFFSPPLVVRLNLRLCARNPNPKHAADRAGTVDMLVRSSLVEMVFSRGSSTYKSWGLNARMWKSRISRFLQEQKLWFSVLTWSEWEQLLPTAKRCAKAAKKAFFLVSGFWNDNCVNSFSRIWNLEVEENLLLEPAIRVSQHLGNEWYFRFFAFLSVSVKWYHDA